MDIFESLNSVLVDLFNDILNIEERALITEEFKDISVTDMHIIEAVGIEEPRTMSTISKSLGVTMGTLTVGINGLVKKGYVTRKRGEKDRRIVYASLTDKGIAAYRHHENFHKDMIENITKLRYLPRHLYGLKTSSTSFHNNCINKGGIYAR